MYSVCLAHTRLGSLFLSLLTDNGVIGIHGPQHRAEKEDGVDKVHRSFGSVGRRRKTSEVKARSSQESLPGRSHVFFRVSHLVMLHLGGLQTTTGKGVTF